LNVKEALEYRASAGQKCGGEPHGEHVIIIIIIIIIISIFVKRHKVVT